MKFVGCLLCSPEYAGLKFCMGVDCSNFQDRPAPGKAKSDLFKQRIHRRGWESIHSIIRIDPRLLADNERGTQAILLARR
jgi:hypothetical protein